MFNDISDVCFLIIALCLAYIIPFRVIIPIIKTKKAAIEYKIVGGRNAVYAVIFASGGIAFSLANFISEKTIFVLGMSCLYFLSIYKLQQFAVIADNKYGTGKNAIDLKNVERVKFYTNRAFDNTEFCFKDGALIRTLISKKILGEVEPLINEKLERIKNGKMFSSKEE
ncbi:MAG: hypothetical protein WC900_00825 [Oscillospiraceae bacterium]